MGRIEERKTVLESWRQDEWYDIREGDIWTIWHFGPYFNPMGSFWIPLISKCSMMPKWHHPDISSGDVREFKTPKTLRVYATSWFLCDPVTPRDRWVALWTNLQINVTRMVVIYYQYIFTDMYLWTLFRSTLFGCILFQKYGGKTC